MQSLPIPIDTARLTFVVVAAPRPRLVNQESGEVKIDKKTGREVFTVGLSATDKDGRADLLSVSVPGDPKLAIGQIVVPAGLVGSAWEQNRDGRLFWGIAYRADSIAVAVTAVAPAGPVKA